MNEVGWLKMHLVPVAGHDWQGDWRVGK